MVYNFIVRIWTSWTMGVIEIYGFVHFIVQKSWCNNKINIEWIIIRDLIIPIKSVSKEVNKIVESCLLCQNYELLQYFVQYLTEREEKAKVRCGNMESIGFIVCEKFYPSCAKSSYTKYAGLLILLRGPLRSGSFCQKNKKIVKFLCKTNEFNGKGLSSLGVLLLFISERIDKCWIQFAELQIP